MSTWGFADPAMSVATDLRHYIDRRRPKRKLDEDAHALFYGTSLSRTRKPDQENPTLDPPCSTSSPALTLHFFVRTISRTLVIHAQPLDTIDSIMDQIRSRTGITKSEQSLVYRGRQLLAERTLADSAVEPDACLHLTGKLRSSEFPLAWQVINDLISVVWYLDTATLDDLSRARKASSVDNLIKNFLFHAAHICEGDESACGHIEVFMQAGAPAALVKLYHSTNPKNRELARRSVGLFLKPSFEYLPKGVHNKYASIVLEFCKLLAATAGKEDSFYIACRDAFAEMLEAKDSLCFVRLKAVDLIAELLPFISELGEILFAGMSSEPMGVTPQDMDKFSNFLHAMRRTVRDWIHGAGPIPKLFYSGVHLQYKELFSSLYSLFTHLLKKANQCLGKVGNFLKQMAVLAEWTPLLKVLTELNRFSKIFEGGGELLHEVLLARRSAVNALVRCAEWSDSFFWLLKHKEVIDSETRRNRVLMMFPNEKHSYQLHEMLIDRSQVLAESFEYIGQVEAKVLHGPLLMEFKNEEATGPGVLREWFCLVCQAIFNPQNVLFVSCPNDQRRFFPNPASVVDPLHLKYFGFCGRVIALALMQRVQVGIVFDRVFFLQLAGKNVSLEDVQDADPSLYMSCKKILDMDANLIDSDVLGLTFIREVEELGSLRDVELCPGGKDIIVNSKNRAKYVDLLIQHRFVISVSEQVSHFVQGFDDMVTKSKFHKLFFQCLDLQEFDQMLGGSNNVLDVRQWKACTEYSGYESKDRQICWFWKIVEGMAAEQRRVLLFFWTSVKYLPVNGFGGLSSKLHIYKALSSSHEQLPTSNTCFYRLNLPAYPSVSLMRKRLELITQEHVSCTFGNY